MPDRPLLKQLRRAFGRSTVDDPDLPSSVADIPPYPLAFMQAIEFTKSLRLDARPLDDGQGPLFSDGHDALFGALWRSGILDVSASAKQCLRWCHFLAPRLERELGVSIQTTVGRLWCGKDPIFMPTWNDLRKLVNQTCPIPSPYSRRPSLRVHAWMTLSSGEIFDPTIFPSLASTGYLANDFAGHVVAGYPDKEPFVRYLPMAVGQAYVEKLGMRMGEAVWARNAQQLVSDRFVL